MTNTLLKYFPDLAENQLRQFQQLPDLYRFWNAQINVISRKDIDELVVRHILHSLSIAKVLPINERLRILDLGTGGGFPGIPLAIYYPESNFHLIDSTAKKIKVVKEISSEIGLINVEASQQRAEEISDNYDQVVTRAVAPAATLWKWIGKKIQVSQNQKHRNGIISLKGGDLKEELKDLKRSYRQYFLKEVYDEEFFQTKQIIHILK